MYKIDFKRYRLTNFTSREIEKTGAKLKDVDPYLFVHLQWLRNAINRGNDKNNIKMKLLRNGLTTGKHTSILHPAGRAVDFTILWGKNKRLNNQSLLGHIITNGFGGIGFYHNLQTRITSYHLDLRMDWSMWKAWKTVTKNKWNYSPLLNY